MTGEQPFSNYKPQELAYYVSLGARPDKPQDAAKIGISDSLWELIRICWDRTIEERPQIQEVVEGVGNSAAKWHTDMPPSPPERREDSFQEESDELKHREFSLISPLNHVVLKSSFQAEYLKPMRAKHR